VGTESTLRPSRYDCMPTACCDRGYEKTLRILHAVQSGVDSFGTENSSGRHGFTICRPRAAIEGTKKLCGYYLRSNRGSIPWEQRVFRTVGVHDRPTAALLSSDGGGRPIYLGVDDSRCPSRCDLPLEVRGGWPG